MTERVVEIQDLAGLDPPVHPPNEDVIVARADWSLRKLRLIEGTQNQAVQVVLSRPLPVEVLLEVVIDYVSDSAEAADYELSLTGAGTPDVGDFLVRIPAGQTTGFFNITVPDDAVAEGTELLDFVLQPYHEVHGLFDITLVQTVGLEALRIVLDDAPAAPPGSVFWSFETDSYVFDEGASAFLTRARVNLTAPHGIPGGVLMRFWTTNGTATGGATPFTPNADFVHLDILYAVSPTALSFLIPFRLINDTTAEGAETFTIHGEVVTPGTHVLNGTFESTVVTINASDIATGPVLAYWAGDINTSGNAEATFVEAGIALRLRILLSASAPQNLFIPVSVVATSGVLSRIVLAWPGGVSGTAVAPFTAAWTDIFLTVPHQQGIQATMTYELTIGAASGVQPGNPSVLEIVVLDNGSGDVPEVSFRLVSQPDVNEGASADHFIAIDVTNAATANLTLGFTVGLSYNSSGGAVYGQDFRIFQTLPNGTTPELPSLVTFPPFVTARNLRLRPINNATAEATETYQITLDSPIGCTIGSVPTTTGRIIDDDQPSGGSGLRPQFYFASEVLGQGVNVLGSNRVNMIADLGPNITFNQDVEITMSHYSPNAVVTADGGVTGDYWFPDDVDQNAPVLRIPAGQRYGKLQFQALPDGVATTRKHVVVVMASTNFGRVDEYWQQTRWAAVLCGGADNEGLVPPADVPDVSLDDFEVYADRIEDLVHGITIALPYDPTQAEVVANYPLAVRTLYGENNSLWNGVAIAAHLAQEVWLDRNNPVARTFGTRVVHTSQPNQGATQLHYLEPHVRWLDVGQPVYISVYEDATNGPHQLLFAGDFNAATIPLAGSVCWGRHITSPTGPAGTPSPSSTRDLYITARGHQHEMRLVEFGAVMRLETFPLYPDLSQRWQTACFTDNIHLTGLRFPTDPTANNDPTASVLGRQPPVWLTSQKLWAGLHFFHLFDWTSADLTIQPDLTFHIRVNYPGSWVITNAIGTRSQRQFAYFDSTGPIFVMAYNQNLECTGRSQLQLVSRNPWRTLNPQVATSGHTSGPVHGLVAIVEDRMDGILGRGDGSDLELYGALAYVFVVGFRHRGEIGYNRRLLTLLASGNEEGMYVADAILLDLASEYVPGSPVNSPEPWFTARYVEVRSADVDVEPAGVNAWANDAFVFAGCWRIVFKAMVNASAGTPMGGRSFFIFNPPDSNTLNWGFGAIMADALNRPVLGEGYSAPPFPRFRNRGGLNNAPAGGVSFPDGFDAIATSGNFCGSTPLARHYLASGLPTSSIPFSALTATQRDNYDGRDPS